MEMVRFQLVDIYYRVKCIITTISINWSDKCLIWDIVVVKGKIIRVFKDKILPDSKERS